jgi:hypothetical protein
MMKRGKLAIGMVVGLAGWGAVAGAATAPVLVSPGDRAGGALVAARCPTFNWSLVEGAVGYELVVYAVRDASDEAEALPPSIRLALPGSATGWTPDLAHCLESGGSYAWSVRALSPDGDGGWSEVSLFSVVPVPSVVRDEELRPAAASPRERGSSTIPDAGDAGSSVEARGARAAGTPARPLGGALLKGGELGTRAPSLGVASLKVNEQIHFGSFPTFFNGPDLFLWSDQWNLGLGHHALKASTGAYAFNTAVGYEALTMLTGGVSNTALGDMALRNNTLGHRNSAVGADALRGSSTGSDNTAVGYRAAAGSSSANTAVGSGALEVASGSANVALGYRAGRGVTSGAGNVVIGSNAGDITTGDWNVVVGNGATGPQTGSWNIVIGGLAGVPFGSNGRIQIGAPGLHTSAFIRGIHGVTVSGGTAVYIKSDGQLGTLTSSRRFKEEIRALDSDSEALWGLRPVAFRYRPEVAPGERPLEYGLIAEEVAEVFPELVVYDEEGTPLTVRYHHLSVLLLDQLQRERHRTEAYRRELEEQRRGLEAQGRALQELAGRLSALEEVER